MPDCRDIRLMAGYNAWMNGQLCAAAAQLSEAELDHVPRYANRLGIVSERHFGSLLLHFFNHQTHHRGQASTLLTQAGVDTGVTGLLVRIPDTSRPD